jgi:hypothetical protein
MGSDIHLASVTSREQQRAVARLANSQANTWIGLNDKVEECGTDGDCFVWSDGEPLEYSNWVPGQVNDGGQPNGNGNAVDVLASGSDYEWDDKKETDPLPYICSKKATPIEAAAAAAPPGPRPGPPGPPAKR